MHIRLVVGFLAVFAACGNQEAPPATPTSPEPGPGASQVAVAPPAPPPPASATASPAASASATATATAEPAPPAFTQTLKELVGSARIIELTWRENLASNEAKTVTIKSAGTIKAILDALGPDQTPGGSTPAYMATYTFRFEDAKGNPLATVSLYSSANLSDEAKKAGRIDLASNGKSGGITVAKYGDLQKKLESIGAPLP